MMARTVAAPDVEVTPEATPEVTPEVSPPEVSPQVIPNFIPESELESPQYLLTWINESSGLEPEALGGFKFFAQQNNWYADTPSGWISKFLRWKSHG